MSEPQFSDAALDRLLGMAPVPPAPRADLAERIVAEATRPGRLRVRPVARRDRRRGWRRSSIITGVIAFNLIAASAIASMITGVPVHVALARLAALPAHLWHPHRVERHAAVHPVRAHAEPARALAGSVAAAAAARAQPPTMFPNALRPVAAAPMASRAGLATIPFGRPSGHAIRPALAHPAWAPQTAGPRALAHARRDQFRGAHVMPTHPRLGVGAREGGRSSEPGAGRFADRAAASERQPVADRGERAIGSGAEPGERAGLARQSPASAERFGQPSAGPPSRAEASERAPVAGRPADAQPRRFGGRGFGRRAGYGMGGRPRWASQVIVNPGMDGSPSAANPAIEAPSRMQQRVGEGAPGQGAGSRPGQRAGGYGPARSPKVGRMPRRQGGFGRGRGGRRRL